MWSDELAVTALVKAELIFTNILFVSIIKLDHHLALWKLRLLVNRLIGKTQITETRIV